ncbi:MAG: Nramp family divalent metal transporter [Chitinophagaceae bacterium]|nr:Nramp family divalent metal transporter [Chitinophagaceae bacterium]
MTSPTTGGARLRDIFRALAPGIITAALVFGPSKVTIATKIGAEYGFTLLWVVVVAIFFMMVFTSMAARIGIATRHSILETMRQKWGKKTSVAMGVGVFLVTASFQAGNSIGLGIALGELTHTRPPAWIVGFNMLAMALLFFRSFYKVLERLMLVLICLMLLAFLATLFLARPSIPGVVGGLLPSVPGGTLPLITAFIASCFSIVAAFYQSYLIQERRRLSPAGAVIKDKSFAGIFILGLITMIVMICAAAVLHTKGIKVNNATDMARALEPIFGDYASVLFLCGLFGASFSALVGNSTLGGTVLADALGYGSALHARANRILIALIMLAGAVVAIVFGKMPLQLIVFAQSVTILIVPFIGIAMFAIANDRKIMGEMVNTTAVKIAGWAGLLLIAGLAIYQFKILSS